MSDPVLAKPPADCCLSGFPHEGTPVGTFISVADVKTYITRPPSSATQNRVILYFPDVWGIDVFLNGQLLCDYFASQGFLVLALDYFRGDPVTVHRKDRQDTTTEPGFDYEAWKAKHQAFAAVAVPKWIDAVKTQFGTPETKYAAVGYCFGAPYVMDALSKTTSTACVGAFGHPAFLNESHFINCASTSCSHSPPSESFCPDSYRNQKYTSQNTYSLLCILGPLFLSCAETDHTFPAPSRHRAEELLTAGKRTFHIQLFSGVEHGFCLRGNMEDAYERFTKEESADGIVRWFKKFM